jgi:hypothetical protein
MISQGFKVIMVFINPPKAAQLTMNGKSQTKIHKFSAYPPNSRKSVFALTQG